jgi:hypothetical protein
MSFLKAQPTFECSPDMGVFLKEILTLKKRSFVRTKSIALLSDTAMETKRNNFFSEPLVLGLV